MEIFFRHWLCLAQEAEKIMYEVSALSCLFFDTKGANNFKYNTFIVTKQNRNCFMRSARYSFPFFVTFRNKKF